VTNAATLKTSRPVCPDGFDFSCDVIVVHAVVMVTTSLSALSPPLLMADTATSMTSHTPAGGGTDKCAALTQQQLSIKKP